MQSTDDTDQKTNKADNLSVGQVFSNGTERLTVLAVYGDGNACDVKIENMIPGSILAFWTPVSETAPDGSPGTIVE